MKKTTIIGIGIIVLVALATFYVTSDRQTFGGGAGQTATSCTTSTVAVATIGNQLSGTVLAAHSNRAWARIEQPINATNTVNLAFNAGTAATITSGLQLTTATTTSPVAYIDFGRNTDFPYTGAVTGITNTGSTTILVTECRY